MCGWMDKKLRSKSGFSSVMLSVMCVTLVYVWVIYFWTYTYMSELASVQASSGTRVCVVFCTETFLDWPKFVPAYSIGL